MTNENLHDVIILGAGAAGLSAGLVLSRAQANVLIIDSGEPRNAPALHMHGFISRDGIAPAEFLAAGRSEVLGYGARIRTDRVASASRREDGSFAVAMTDGTVEAARALLLATGLTDEVPAIPGIRERWGTLVHHCPYCHGFEVIGQSIAVIGGSMREMSLKQAGLLRRQSDDVSFITNGIELSPDERHRLGSYGVRVVDGLVSHLDGEPGTLAGLTLTDGRIIGCEAAFVAPRLLPNDELLRSLAARIDPTTGLVQVDIAGQTSVPGVWAAGNVVTPSAQVITAAGAGSASAIAINGWLLQNDLDIAASAHS